MSIASDPRSRPRKPRAENVDWVVALLRQGRDVAELVWRRLMYWHWVLQSFGQSRVALASAIQDVTVIIPAFSPTRVRNLAPLVRTLLRCSFVGRVVISRNNPELDVTDLYRFKDGRLSMIEHPTKRGCGVVWAISAEIGADYVIVIDDDVLVYPAQLRKLFEALLKCPGVPHGLCGQRGLRYVVGRNAEVENLFSIYAITSLHARRYSEMTEQVLQTGRITAETMEFLADDVVLSRVGDGPPRVHDAGYFLLCPTATSRAVAVFKQDGFSAARREVLAEVNRIREQEHQFGIQPRDGPATSMAAGPQASLR